MRTPSDASAPDRRLLRSRSSAYVVRPTTSPPSASTISRSPNQRAACSRNLSTVRRYDCMRSWFDGPRSDGAAPRLFSGCAQWHVFPNTHPHKESHHVRGPERSRYHRAGSRLLGDSAKLGTLDPALRSPRLPGARPCVPGTRGRGRSAQSRSLAHRASHGARDHGAPRDRCRGTRAAADPHRAFGGRGVRPAAARPWLWRGWRDARLRTDRGRARHAAGTAQVELARAEESGESAQGGGPRLRAVALHL